MTTAPQDSSSVKIQEDLRREEEALQVDVSETTDIETRQGHPFIDNNNSPDKRLSGGRVVSFAADTSSKGNNNILEMKQKGPSVILKNQRKNVDNFRADSSQRLTASDSGGVGGGIASGLNTSNSSGEVDDVHQSMLHDDDYIREKLNPSTSDQESGVMGFRNSKDYLWSKTYLLTRLTLGFLNLISLCLKTPLLIFLLRMVVEVLVAKKEEARVTTIEPPYEEDLVPANPVNPEDEAAAKAARRAIMIETGTLLVIYVGMLLIHLLCSLSFWMNKGLFHIIFYIPVLLTWLFFSITSYFVNEWKWPLNFIFLIFKAFFHGSQVFGPPDRMELALVRICFWFDGVTFLLTIGFLIMALRFPRELKREKLRCRPHYNLLKLF